jgi:hypothetical protein
MNKGTYVYCQTRFIGFHCWEDAPPQVGYLRAVHRHEFHVKLTVKVDHDNRDVEFITMRKQLDKYLNHPHPSWQLTISCEMIAQMIEVHMREQYRYEVASVEVSEDGENGAILIC